MNLISAYTPYIENIYMGIPELKNHVSLQHQSGDENQVYDLLSKTQNLHKRIVVFNSISYNKDDNDVFKLFDTTINPIIEKYKIDGFVVTSLPLAIKLRRDFPNLELHTSCNSFQWNIRQMKLWESLAGISTFNPPREAAKTPSMLKEMHKAGFKLKVLLNEACLYGCPFTINHACGVAEGKKTHISCSLNDYSNALRTNLFLPQWLDTIDEYVYCYKLSGRDASYECLKKILDAYILQKPMTYIDEISTYGGKSAIRDLESNGIRIKISDIPEKTRYCEAKECNTSCFICSNKMQQINKI
jgi:hypothetical protein